MTSQPRLHGLNGQPIPNEAAIVVAKVGFDCWHVEAHWQMADGTWARVPCFSAYHRNIADRVASDYRARLLGLPAQTYA